MVSNILGRYIYNFTSNADFCITGLNNLLYANMPSGQFVCLNNIEIIKFECLKSVVNRMSEIMRLLCCRPEEGYFNDIDGEKYEASSIKFAIGGRSTVKYEKLGFNIKIKKGNLLGVKQLRLRTEIADPTFMREKLLYDISTLIDLPSLSLNYVRLYFNDRFMGFYAMRDAIKSSYIESKYNEKKTTHLYECDGNYGSSHVYNCINDDEDLRASDVDFNNFLAKIEKTNSKSELAEFLMLKIILSGKL